MKILQGSNGKIQFWVNGGIVFSCLPSLNYRVKNTNEIHLINAGIKVLSIFADEITHTQILGGTITPTTFIDAQAMAVFLDTNFFFDLGGGSNVFSEFGITGEYFQTQTTFNSYATSAALNMNRQYFIPIRLSGLRSEFTFLKLGSAFTGNFNFAIYKGDRTPGADFVPTERVWQSAEKSLTVAQELVSESVSISFLDDWYFLGYQGDAAFTFTGASAYLGFLGVNITGIPSFSAITWWYSALGYASSFPANWVTPLINENTGIPPLFVQKR